MYEIEMYLDSLKHNKTDASILIKSLLDTNLQMQKTIERLKEQLNK